MNTCVQAAERDLRSQEEDSVAIARTGRYDEALEQLTRLSSQGLPVALWDEIVVLGWAGRHEQATTLFEKNPGENWPEYVRLSVAGSYYRLEHFKMAAQLYHDVAKTGNSQAKRWEAESLMRLGDRTAADDLYLQILAEHPQDADVYLSRGNMYLLAGDIEAGTADLERAMDLAVDSKVKNQVGAQVAALYIQNGDYGKGITCLKPAIDNGSATPFMQADYIFALRLNGDYTTAIKEGRRLWPKTDSIPVYGIQALADSYLRSGQSKSAITLYRSLLERQQDDVNRKDVQGGLAFATMLDGQVAEGKVLYDNLLTKYPGFAPVAAGDAAAFMEKGRYWTAKVLFQLVIHKFPDNRMYRQQFAGLLASKGMPREAAEEYAALAKMPNSQPNAGAGLAVNSLEAGDYQLARQGVGQLANQSIRKPIVGQAVEKFAERPQGQGMMSTSVQKDYKGNDIKDFGMSGEQRLTDRLLFTIGADTKKIADFGADTHYKTLSPGFRYQDVGQALEAAVYHYSGDIHANGYHAAYTHYFGDQANLSLKLDRLPVDEGTAIAAGVFQTSQRVEYNKSLGKTDSYLFGLTRSTYNDGNQTFGYDGEWEHTYYDQEDTARSMAVYFSRNRFKQQIINDQVTPYESPALRENYGVSWRQHWTIPNGYWENTLNFEWSRDHPENFSFSPYDRLEYGYRLAQRAWLTFGVEYGLRTVHDGGGFWFDHRSYDMNYRLVW
ncbi:biofilm PGA synthesis protein PgaA [Sporomusaceae bacterium BoRhaA]|nr:biofilm PGA synthesis protein PgaA [Pelorhabdus rhamnosifermentans]